MKIFAQSRTTVNLQDLPSDILTGLSELAINTITFVETESQMSPSYYVISLSDNSLNRSQIAKIASIPTSWDVHISSMASKLTLTCFKNS